MVDNDPARGEMILFQPDAGETRVRVRLHNGAVWLSQQQIGALYDRDKSTISRHIANIFEEGELVREATVAESATVSTEGDRTVERTIEYYSLEMVLAIGYRVKSRRGIQFRTWATARLKDYIVKGFAMDDGRLKEAGGGDYFDELLARIRDIRSSEKVFYKKVLEIYATRVDYDARDEATQRFFQTVQNKMHWAAHGHTAAEVIVERADADQPNMGLTSFAGERPTRAEAQIAKNYLDADELDALNKIVTAYLDFAEVQALSRKPMTMAAWITKLDDFLRLGDREILTHAGLVSREVADDKASAEFKRFQAGAGPSPVERAFDDAVQASKLLAKAKKP
jgi:hypothetical protein